MLRITPLKVPSLIILIALIAAIAKRDTASNPKMDYERWLSAGNHEKAVSAYAGFLRSHGVEGVLPMQELLSASRDWRQCGVDPWSLPPASAWPAMVPTLKLLERLRQSGLTTGARVTSSYRNVDLNRCAGGKPASKHLANAALDLRLSPASAASEHEALCGFWRRHGREHRMGLGLYRSGQVHIDTQGYRQWDPRLTPGVPPCRDAPAGRP